MLLWLSGKEQMPHWVFNLKLSHKANIHAKKQQQHIGYILALVIYSHMNNTILKLAKRGQQHDY